MLGILLPVMDSFENMMKFQFVGELKSSRICHGCVAVAFSLSSAGYFL